MAPMGFDATVSTVFGKNINKCMQILHEFEGYKEQYRQ